jgi:hypothetical protein
VGAGAGAGLGVGDSLCGGRARQSR